MLKVIEVWKVKVHVNERKFEDRKLIFKYDNVFLSHKDIVNNKLHCVVNKNIMYNIFSELVLKC